MKSRSSIVEEEVDIVVSASQRPQSNLTNLIKIIVDFRTDLHKMKINTELCCKRYDFLTKKTQNYRYQNYCLDDKIQIYSYGILCEHLLSMRTV